MGSSPFLPTALLLRRQPDCFVPVAPSLTTAAVGGYSARLLTRSPETIVVVLENRCPIGAKLESRPMHSVILKPEAKARVAVHLALPYALA